MKNWMFRNVKWLYYAWLLIGAGVGSLFLYAGATLPGVPIMSVWLGFLGGQLIALSVRRFVNFKSSMQSTTNNKMELARRELGEVMTLEIASRINRWVGVAGNTPDPVAAGDLCLCSQGTLGLVLSQSPEEITYTDGQTGKAWTGIHVGTTTMHERGDSTRPKITLHTGDQWASRDPHVVVGNLAGIVQFAFQRTLQKLGIPTS